MRIAQFAVLAAAAILGCGLGTHLCGCQRQKAAPSIDGLSEALERSAEKTLAAPSLADERYIIPARPGDTDAQAREIERLIWDAGGTSVESGTGRMTIFADVPAAQVQPFRAALGRFHGQYNGPWPTIAGSGTGHRTIEVLIDSVEPSPSP